MGEHEVFRATLENPLIARANLHFSPINEHNMIVI